ncbi:4'-phosphopantetheinyl transferase family protein [Halodesulfovibrio aestuarii]|uniref:4'-phosphopantetheinyl transferase n=1 Tax=Halodesulfovibrio aestuarii TaxID=126333 RepID=A0A8G2CBH3_9BACT|nr:4'-phosphopantetheinyl transferase superfamily protein [Halodesulfovibrio aestuarii]SHJ56047.1 4'-phosphopantetheinyl transferase [Halodesulfovibrio aestuarii]
MHLDIDEAGDTEDIESSKSQIVWCSEALMPRLSINAIHIWMQEFAQVQFCPSWFNVLDHDEKALAKEYVTPELYERYVIAHFFVRKVLARYLNCSPEHVFLYRGRYGKPMLGNDQLSFSISHTDKRVLVAVSADSSIGIDAEEIGDIPEWELIARRWFSREELEWLFAQPDIPEAFLHCWVRREALLKAHGAGFELPFERIRMPTCSGCAQVLLAQEHFVIKNVNVHCAPAVAQWVCALAYRL